MESERKAVIDRMKVYSIKTKADFPPIPSERKRVELELIKERTEGGGAKRFRRVGLQTLARSAL